MSRLPMTGLSRLLYIKYIKYNLVTISFSIRFKINNKIIKLKIFKFNLVIINIILNY